MSGRLFVVSGPSGAGKSSLCTALLERCPDLKLSISSTTRAPRPGEQNGREYFFLTAEAFSQQQHEGMFLEWAQVHGNTYGTRQADIERILEAGDDVLLEIDWQGAAQVALRMPQAIRIFILPPSIEELRKRLVGRAQDDEQVVEQRLAAAEMEISHDDEAHIKIINEDFAEALQLLERITCRGKLTGE